MSPLNNLPRLHELAAQLIADGWPPLAAWAEARDRLSWLTLQQAIVRAQAQATSNHG